MEIKLKPGYKTTEFGLSAVVAVWSAVSGSVPAPWNAIIPAVAAGVYTVMRTLAKNGVFKRAFEQELFK